MECGGRSSVCRVECGEGAVFVVWSVVKEQCLSCGMW